MGNLPRVLVGGTPNSGTSFLCNLVHEMGLSAGSHEHLKPPDEHNRWGYWEYLPIRDVTWELFASNFRFENQKTWPFYPFPLVLSKSKEIALIAETDNVEVYKDNLLPFVYKQFDVEAKCVMIRRDARECYESPGRAGMPGYDVSFDEFNNSYVAYWFYVDYFIRYDRNLLVVEYEGFANDFAEETSGIADFLGISLERTDYERLGRLYHPRGN